MWSEFWKPYREEAARLVVERHVALICEDGGTVIFWVEDEIQTYRVRLKSNGTGSYTCADWEYWRAICPHILASQLFFYSPQGLQVEVAWLVVEGRVSLIFEGAVTSLLRLEEDTSDYEVRLKTDGNPPATCTCADWEHGKAVCSHILASQFCFYPP